ncbi:MAG: transglutaminase domain-containing protein, partial [Pedobacter sp.]
MRITAEATCLAAMFVLSADAWGKTLVVEGELSGKVEIRKNVTFAVDNPLDKFSYQIAIPSAYDSGGNLQRLDDFQVTSTPPPTEIKEVTDTFGNRYRKLSWQNLKRDAHTTIYYTTTITASLAPRISSAPFPIHTIPEPEKVFLKGTKLVQSEARQVKELASELTADATTEHQAITAILSYVADAITYQYSPRQHDALYGLTTGTGNCQNFSHLALALLRASGIPARIVVGQTLKDKWKIPLDEKGSSLVQAMGEGLHAWIEVFYTDQGWLPCDPMQSRLFTSTRHIKLAHGLDADDMKDYWSGSPYVPQMSESITANYLKDAVSLTLHQVIGEPKNYQIAG